MSVMGRKRTLVLVLLLDATIHASITRITAGLMKDDQHARHRCCA